MINPAIQVFKDILRKRALQISTVALVETSDLYILEELKKIASSIDPHYFYSMWRGLYTGASWKMVNPRQALAEIEKGLVMRQTGVAILYNIPKNQLKELEPAILEWVSADSPLYTFPEEENPALVKVFGVKKIPPTIMIVAPFIKGIISEDILQNTIFYHVPLPDEQQRYDFINLSFGTHVNIPEEKLLQLSKVTAGMTYRQIKNAMIEALPKNFDISTIVKIKREIIRNTTTLSIEDPKISFADVGGYNYIKQYIKINIIKVLLEPQRAMELGVPLPKGILLFGPPGTGKTLIAEALAKEVNLPFIRFDLSQVVSKWYGESQQRMRHMFEIIERIGNSIVFFDEIDRLKRRGESGEHEVTRQLHNMFLEYLGKQDRKSIFVATTNIIEDLDEALLRPGRFSNILLQSYPDKQARIEIFKVHIRKRNMPVENINLQELASKTKWFTGAEIEQVVINAAVQAFQEERNTVTQDDFIQAIRDFNIDLTHRADEHQKYIDSATRFVRSKELVEKIKKTFD